MNVRDHVPPCVDGGGAGVAVPAPLRLADEEAGVVTDLRVLLQEGGEARVAGQVLLVAQQGRVVPEDLVERRRVLLDHLAQPLAGFVGVAAIDLVDLGHRRHRGWGGLRRRARADRARRFGGLGRNLDGCGDDGRGHQHAGKGAQGRQNRRGGRRAPELAHGVNLASRD
jgi:hypothetical protein